MIGTRLIVDKLGHGGYSTVCLVQDKDNQQYVALEINKAKSVPRETKALRTLSASSTHPGREAIPAFLDECHLRDISFSHLFPLDVARALSYRLAQAVAYVHSQGYVHGDIHLDNVLARLPLIFDELTIDGLYEKYGKPETIVVTRCDGKPVPRNGPARAVLPLFLGRYAEKFSLAETRPSQRDFGEAFCPASGLRLGKDCHTPPALRGPETDHDPEAPFTYPSDIWSLATAIWAIIGMRAIFTTEYIPGDQILAQQVDVLGPLPSHWWYRWEGRKKFFTEDGTPAESYKRDKWQEAGDQITEAEKVAFPEERMTIEEVLKSEWMRDWALPDYEQSLQTCNQSSKN
ncbi:kinase-like protein [Aspergillus homomorphus CBS 101889]|uniref:Kinase-like protein n=1 Tax=Aspergillus homomorphus (strain CBS 101889) TaxID=1450537 RepID=A0A395I3H8_ASPHC|nr:kinase-like protein [Aspergillus homomorphus CBS 101889]RAL14751.1 kinase-like protein [Aspergillus homomorphus CBS 101889]